MALPMLVSGSDCGPLNPLQGLAKRFDHDRGLQQDHFGSGRAGSSREAFRTQQTGTTGFDQDAAAFFNANSTPVSQLATPNAFDLSALHASLSSSHMQSSVQSPQIHQQNAAAAWASDFMQRQLPEMNLKAEIQSQQAAGMKLQQPTGGLSPGGVQWNPALSGYRMKPMQELVHGIPFQTQTPRIHADQSTWDKEFQSQEKSFTVLAPVIQPLKESQQAQDRQDPHDADELARTAGLLVESVKNEQNPKFRNSEFLGLMEQLRDRTVVVEGNQMVQADGLAESATTKWSNGDAKGKAKAVDPPPPTTEQIGMRPGILRFVHQGVSDPSSSMGESVEEDPNEAYFRQENEEYTQYWSEYSTEAVPQRHAASAESTAWDHLQQSWDQFEATSSGIKAINNYQFQINNPYLLGDSSRTRHHTIHSDGYQTFHESVLALEAAVQRDPAKAGSWFELGVKQQENEREQKAIQALERAVELDPTHLPAWLALATSYSNDCNRNGTYHAIKQWVDRNKKLEGAVRRFRTEEPQSLTASSTERFDHLIRCLIIMAQCDTSDEIDPDIQIALAVLLNTNEDYDKAQDCFRTALAVRPDDWLLYNRVGATMANSGHAEDALQYYYRALELNPIYIRARFNLGISCINLRRYEEAGQHILDALVLQDSDSIKDSTGLSDKRGVVSSALWDSLKTTCLYMQKIDLATLCDQRDLEGFRRTFQQ